MFCQRCGAELAADWNACPKCAASIGGPAPYLPQTPTKKGGIGCFKGCLIVFVGFIVLGAIGAAINPQGTTSSTGPSYSAPASSPSSPSRAASAPTTEQGITKANFDRIRTGMTYQQAVDILGKSGEVMSDSNVAGYQTTMYVWKNWNGSNMNAMFQNGKLISKAQFGL